MRKNNSREFRESHRSDEFSREQVCVHCNRDSIGIGTPISTSRITWSWLDTRYTVYTYCKLLAPRVDEGETTLR